MAGLHARLAPSSSKMWIECAASAGLEDLPGDDDETIYAKEGTAAHQVACKALESGEDAAFFIGMSAYGMEVTEEMTEAVQQYLDLCRAEASHTTPEGTEVIYGGHPEDKITLDSLNPPSPVWGTTDFWVLKTHTQTLTVIDYKHGKHVVVDAHENDQGRCYGLGVLLKLIQQLPEQARALRWIEVVICQPRAYHRDGPVRRERIPVDELIRWYRERLLPAIVRTSEPDPMFKAGPHCRFCRRAGRCVTRQEYELKHAELLYQPGDAGTALVAAPPAPNYLTPEQIRRVLDAAPGLRDWLNAVEKYALKSNIVIPGMKRVESYGHRTWTDASTIIPILVKLFCFSEDEVAPRVPRSPTQIEKLLPKSRKPVLANFYTRPPRGLTLVPDNDARQAIDAGDLAVKLFTPPTDP